jgi:hypothetical protein
LKNNISRKEVSMEPPQYNRDLLGLQKREYLARKEIDFVKECIVDLIIKWLTMVDKNGDGLHERCGFVRSGDQSFMSLSMLLRRVLPRLAPDLSKFPLPFPPDLFGPSIFDPDPWGPRILRQHSSRFPLRPVRT